MRQLWQERAQQEVVMRQLEESAAEATAILRGQLREANAAKEAGT